MSFVGLGGCCFLFLSVWSVLVRTYCPDGGGKQSHGAPGFVGSDSQVLMGPCVICVFPCLLLLLSTLPPQLK